MEIRGDLLTDKENAGAALLDACKEVKTSDPVQIGSYRGYAMSVEFSAWKQEYTLLLKGQMTHGQLLVQTRAEILPVSTTHWRRCPSVWKRSKISWRTFTSSRPQPRRKLESRSPLRTICGSRAAGVGELDTLLNIDGKGHAQPETVVAKSARPSVLDSLKRLCRHAALKRNQNNTRRYDDYESNRLEYSSL